MMIGAHKTYQMLIEAIIKCKPEECEIFPVLSEECNNMKLFYELQTQPAQQLYYRPIYNDNYEITREIRVKRIRNYVIKEDTVNDLRKAEQRIHHWLQISQKKHPNLLNLKAAVIQKNTCKYVTEYIDGVTLDVLQNKKLHIQEKVSIITQMIDGLRVLHSQSLIHGDIKPSNFMVTSHLQVIIMDLDQLGYEGQQPDADMTYLYSLKDATQPSLQGDVWSLGLCIYSLFFGQRIEKNWTISEYKKRDFHALSIKSYGPIQEILEASIIECPKDIWYLSSLSKYL